MNKLMFLIIIAVSLCGCSSVPATGRQQLLLVSNQEVLNLSIQQYNGYMKSALISDDKINTELVERVGKNIADAVARYYKSIGMEFMLDGYSWEFNLIKDIQVNAFCMPGGKIVVYEGILPYTQNESGLAVVLGHEVAHAIAKHANERLSQQIITQYGASAVNGLLGKSSSSIQTLGNIVFGLGAPYGVLLPFNKKQELEADHMGLIFMTMAGYNPSEAIPFWRRMASQEGTRPPEFMNAHPSDENRIQKIRKYLPNAMNSYNEIMKSRTDAILNQQGAIPKQRETAPKQQLSPKTTKNSENWKF